MKRFFVSRTVGKMDLSELFKSLQTVCLASAIKDQIKSLIKRYPSGVYLNYVMVPNSTHFELMSAKVALEGPGGYDFVQSFRPGQREIAELYLDHVILLLSQAHEDSLR